MRELQRIVADFAEHEGHSPADARRIAAATETRALLGRCKRSLPAKMRASKDIGSRFTYSDVATVIDISTRDNGSLVRWADGRMLVVVDLLDGTELETGRWSMDTMRPTESRWPIETADKIAKASLESSPLKSLCVDLSLLVAGWKLAAAITGETFASCRDNARLSTIRAQRTTLLRAQLESAGRWSASITIMPLTGL